MSWTPPLPAALAGWRRTAPRWSAFAVLALAPLAPAQALVTHLDTPTFSVDVRPGSDLLGWFAGVQVTHYTTLPAITGNGVVLEARPGQYNTLSQGLKLHFQARPGYEFTTMEFSHLLAWWVVEGGASASMSWVMDNGFGTPLGGSTPTRGSSQWFTNATWSDFDQVSGLLPVNARSFDLDVTLNYTTQGFPGGCSSGTGTCAHIAAAQVKLWASTAVAPIPEPQTLAMWLAGLGFGAWRLRRR